MTSPRRRPTPGHRPPPPMSPRRPAGARAPVPPPAAAGGAAMGFGLKARTRQVTFDPPPPPEPLAADHVCPVCHTPVGSAREIISHVPLAHGAAGFALAIDRPDLARIGHWSQSLQGALLAASRSEFQ